MVHPKLCKNLDFISPHAVLSARKKNNRKNIKLKTKTLVLWHVRNKPSINTQDS